MVRACYIQLERINFSALACECMYPIWDVHSYYVMMVKTTRKICFTHYIYICTHKCIHFFALMWADPHKLAFFTVGFPIHSASPHRTFIKIS